MSEVTIGRIVGKGRPRAQVGGPRGLLVEMLELAVDQCSGHRLNVSGRESARQQWRYRDSARRWLLNLDPDAVVPLDVTCDAANLDPAVVVNRLLRAGALRWRQIPPCQPRGRAQSTTRAL